MRRLTLLAALLLVVVTASGSAFAAERPSTASGLYTNGRQLDPVGRQTVLGDFPSGGALSPDGRFYWAVNAGEGRTDVRVMEVATGAVTQVLPIPGGYVGIAFAPDGRHAYVSGLRQGCCNYDPALLKGLDGDVVHVYGVDPSSGRATEQDPLVLPGSSGGSGRQNELPPNPSGPAVPVGIAVTPDSRTLVVALGNADRVAIFDLTGARAARLVDVGAYPYGVAIAPDGRRAYVSNEYDGTVSVVDLAGDRVVGTVGVGGGTAQAAEGRPSGDRNAHPEGLLVDPRRPRLYVAVANRDLVAVVDTDHLDAAPAYVDVGRRGAPVGTAPTALALAPDGETLYVADSGEDAVAAVALTDRSAGSGGGGPNGTAGSALGRPHAVYLHRSGRSIVRYRARRASLERRTRRALHAAHTRARRAAVRRRAARRLRALRRTLLYGRRARRCAGPTRAQDRAYARRVLRAARRRAAVPRRRRPLADRRFGRALRAALRRLPRVVACRATPARATRAEAGVRALSVIGRLPTAAYPTGVAVTPDGKTLVWLAAKGPGAGPNPDYGGHFADSNSAPYGSYVPQKLIGRAGVLPRPTDAEMRAFDERARRAVTPANAEPRPPGTPLVGPGGGASDRIKYVFYVVRENRTYDQVFGADPRGDGDPRLELLGDNGKPGPTGGVTPNAHALTRRFPLLDSVYANSEVSVDGHLITAGGYAPDYAQKGLHTSYSGRGKGDDVDIFPVSFPPNAFVPDQAVRQGLPFRVYGEVGAGNQPLGDDGRPTYPQVVANTDSTDYASNLQVSCLTGRRPGGSTGDQAANLLDCAQDSGQVGTTGLGSRFAASSRIDSFQRQFQQQLATDAVPRFNYLALPNDHTNGARPGTPTPQATIADNDLALGQLVELVSQSRIWDQSAIFVVEDDSQDGADHVDAHRMPAFVISPWARRGAVVSTRYDTYSFLRTAMMIVGLKPLSLNDALATPLYDAFVSGSEAPDVEGTRYRAIQPEQSFTELNPSSGRNARLSEKMPYDRLDAVPQAISDRILWQSVHGARSRPPSPGPGASPEEHARAVGALRAYRRGADPARWLARHGDPEGDG